MAVSLALTQNDLSKLLCNGCSKFLSVIPITMVDGMFFCGRCKTDGFRITIYEELAKHMSFPCSNKPCSASLKFDQVKEHETFYCPFKVIVCPKPNCNLLCKAVDMYPHFVENHSELVFENSFQVKRTLRDLPIENFNAHKAAYLYRYQNRTYIVMIYGSCQEDEEEEYIESYSYSFGVFYLYKDNYTKKFYDACAILTYANDEEENFDWNYKQIRLYNPKEHCLNCLERNCHYDSHKNTGKKFLRDRIRYIENEGDDIIIKYYVDIGEETHQPAQILQQTSDVALASRLKCPICFNYLCTPIYNCDSGHSMCSNCKRNMRNCGFCRAVIGDSRNYALEEISETTELPCDYADQGCRYIGLVKNLRNHLVNCRYYNA